MKILTMLINLAEPFLRFIEMEEKIIKKKIMNLIWALAFIVISALLVLAASGFFLLGIYQYLTAQMPPAAASILVSILSVILALIFACLAKCRTD
ncbi:MAG: hypothetical protein PHX78_09090 [bacterium]|nr:hypothetical protein [bacterium]